ncbi:hypothetical protein E2320_015582 [Naja naja]|nr:hypothetical protein E2320_015582 [Naja naja]
MARRAVIRSSLLSPPSYYEAVHDGRGPTSPEYPFFSGWYHYMGQEPLSYKRRGGIVDQRDVIMAHQAHKIHNTPQAKRKEWESDFDLSLYVIAEADEAKPNSFQVRENYCIKQFSDAHQSY